MLLKSCRPVLLLVLCAGACFLLEKPVAAGPALDATLDRAGRSVDIFWQQVASFACTERVTQQKIGKKDKIEYKKESVFDYLAFARGQKDGLSVEEQRTPKKEAKNKTSQPALLTTNGFPTLLLVFHPSYRKNYRYEMETGCGEDRGLICIRFEHIPGTPSSCALKLQDRIYPLDLQGTALIDVDSGSIRKITTSLMSPMKVINIKSFHIEVTYAPQTFASDPQRTWLPDIAVIDLQTALQHWRNIHRYSEYKRFTVESIESPPK
jgi:hypothetical protein